jgi:TetR/AcrR family fatty acid metabolism transcriptional regulator
MVCACFEKYRHGKRENRRNHILDAAFAAFIEKGIGNAKMEDIAREAGYGKSTLYEYFDSKDAILSELLRVKFTERYERMAADAAKERGPEAKLRAFLISEMDMIREYGGHERLEGILMSNPEDMMASGFFQTLHNIILRKYTLIAGYIEEGIRTGAFLPTNPYIAASLVIGSSMSYLGTVSSSDYRQAVAGTGAEEEDHLGIYFDLMFRALRK